MYIEIKIILFFAVYIVHRNKKSVVNHSIELYDCMYLPFLMLSISTQNAHFETRVNWKIDTVFEHFIYEILKID